MNSHRQRRASAGQGADIPDITRIASARNNGNGGSITVPGTVEAGDLCLIVHVSDSASGETKPSGFISIGTDGQTSANEIGAYKIWTGSEGSTLSGLNGQAWCAVWYRYVDQTTPMDVSPQKTTNSFSGAIDPPSITTVTNNCQIVTMGALDDDDVTFGAPSGYTSIVQQNANNNGTAGIMERNALLSPAGFHNPPAWSNGSDAAGEYTIALRPANGG